MDEVRKFKKHSAYYTAPFPILSQVRTQTHKHRIQNEAAEQNNLPDRLSDTEKKRLLCEVSGVFIFSVIKEEPHSFCPL